MASAETKFRRSYRNFPDEWTKVEYLRGYCQEAAYNVIKLRALPTAGQRYTHRQELYDELNEHFGVRDKQRVALNKIIHGKIKQGDSEQVGTFLARFNQAAVEANLDVTAKLMYALQNLNGRFKNPAVNNSVVDESWGDFTARLRVVEANAIAAYGNATIKKDTKKDSKSADTKKTDENKAGSNSSSTRDKNDPKGCWRPKEQFNRIIKQQVCARCFRPGHRGTDKDAPCHDTDKLPFSRFEEMYEADLCEEAPKDASL